MKRNRKEKNDRSQVSPKFNRANNTLSTKAREEYFLIQFSVFQAHEVAILLLTARYWSAWSATHDVRQCWLPISRSTGASCPSLKNALWLQALHSELVMAVAAQISELPLGHFSIVLENNFWLPLIWLIYTNLLIKWFLAPALMFSSDQAF